LSPYFLLYFIPTSRENDGPSSLLELTLFYPPPFFHLLSSALPPRAREALVFTMQCAAINLTADSFLFFQFSMFFFIPPPDDLITDRLFGDLILFSVRESVFFSVSFPPTNPLPFISPVPLCQRDGYQPCTRRSLLERTIPPFWCALFTMPLLSLIFPPWRMIFSFETPPRCCPYLLPGVLLHFPLPLFPQSQMAFSSPSTCPSSPPVFESASLGVFIPWLTGPNALDIALWFPELAGVSPL